MLLLLSLLAIGVFFLLVVSASWELTPSSVSLFELRRRRDHGDTAAGETLKREELLLQWKQVLPLLQVILLVLLTVLLIQLLGWGWGALTAVLGGVISMQATRSRLVASRIAKLTRRYEPKILIFMEKRRPLLRFLAGKAQLKEKRPAIGSHEELEHVLENSRIFSESERQLIKSVLRFNQQRVSDIMTLREAVVSVKHSELLGPLVLSDLHATGHTIFPVMKGDDIIGLLDSSDHVSLRNKDSVRASSVMQVDVHTVQSEAALADALGVVLESKQQLLVVLDENNQPVGILSLGDVVRALLGRSLR